MIYHLTGTLRGTDLSEVWIVDGKLRHSAPGAPGSGVAGSGVREDGVPGGGPVCEISGFVYPGLVDAHTHPGAGRGSELIDDAEAVRRLDASRSKGVTYIREMGAQKDVAHLAAPGRTKVLRAGQHIARFKRYIRYLPVDVEPNCLVEETVRQAVRGDGWVKIVGDWIDRSMGADADLKPLWPREELVEAVAAAHDFGVKVAVHTFARETIDDLLVAGVDSIEHGTGMTRDHMAEAAARGIIVDPTVRQIGTFPQIAAQAMKYPVYRDHMLAMYTRMQERMAEFLEAGTHFVMGSDTSDNVTERGLDIELQWAVASGMPASVAMASASYKGRHLLGLPSWEEGAPADLVVYANDPEADIVETSRPSWVFVDGIPGGPAL